MWRLLWRFWQLSTRRWSHSSTSSCKASLQWGSFSLGSIPTTFSSLASVKFTILFCFPLSNKKATVQLYLPLSCKVASPRPVCHLEHDPNRRKPAAPATPGAMKAQVDWETPNGPGVIWLQILTVSLIQYKHWTNYSTCISNSQRHIRNQYHPAPRHWQNILTQHVKHKANLDM